MICLEHGFAGGEDPGCHTHEFLYFVVLDVELFELVCYARHLTGCVTLAFTLLINIAIYFRDIRIDRDLLSRVLPGKLALLCQAIGARDEGGLHPESMFPNVPLLAPLLVFQSIGISAAKLITVFLVLENSCCVRRHRICNFLSGLGNCVGNQYYFASFKINEIAAALASWL